MSRSEIAKFREQQALEGASAQLGLNGFAQMATHEAINARVQRGAKRILHLAEQGQHAQALALMEQPQWGELEDEACK